jgi:hypothetical protein
MVLPVLLWRDCATISAHAVTFASSISARGAAQCYVSTAANVHIALREWNLDAIVTA